MKKYLKSRIKSTRLNGLPQELRAELRAARKEHGWNQTELGHRVGLPQGHVSGIEGGRIVPRFDTLLDLVRVLDRDLVLVPRSLVPAVTGLIRDHRAPDRAKGERPLYATDEEEEANQEEEDSDTKGGPNGLE
jgi:transcriptional regulator with XRE-family HTH domain